MPNYRSLPKVDLHRHLEGSLRLETLWELHQRERQTLHGSIDGLRAAYTIPEGDTPGLLNFLARFEAARFTFGGLREVERVAAESVEDAALDGVIHLELRFSPVFFARRMRNSSQDLPASLVEDAACAVISAAQNEASAKGVGVIFIVTLGRHFGAEVNRPAVELLNRDIGRQISGLDLAGDESYEASEFRPFFDEWKKAGKGLTIHAGEDSRIKGATNVREALDFGADRIGHGVRTVLEPDLLARVIESESVLEMCPTSNVQTRACESFRTHPLKQFLSKGARATINTDDPSVSQTTLSEECRRAEEYCGLSFDEVLQCNLNAAKGAFLPLETRMKLVEHLKLLWKSA